MTASLPTKREFLNSVTNPATGQPYAGLTRGRFSSEALAFADENKDKWADAPVVVRTPRAPAAPKAAAAPAVAAPKAETPAVDPKAVRAWAKQNGHTVGERGRIHGDVTAAYLAAGGKVHNLPTAARPTPNLMPKVRTQTVAWGVVKPVTGDGPWARPFVLGASKCSKGHSIDRCNCETMMTSKMGPIPSVPLSLTKPVI